MQGSQRISVRVSEDQFRRIHTFCQASGCNLSHVLREALERLLAGSSGSTLAEGAQTRLTPPDAVFDAVPRYLGGVNGDIRQVRSALFCELLAASFVAKQHWPRSPGMIEGYQALLQLCEFFGL